MSNETTIEVGDLIPIKYMMTGEVHDDSCPYSHPCNNCNIEILNHSIEDLIKCKNELIK